MHGCSTTIEFPWDDNFEDFLGAMHMSHLPRDMAADDLLVNSIQRPCLD